MGQTCLSVGATAAAIGGLASWAPWAMGGAVALALWPLVLAVRSPQPPQWRAFLPAGLFALYVVAQLLNPSHTVDPAAGWLPRSAWVSWLPTTMDRSRTVVAALPWLLALLQAGAVGAVLQSRRAVRQLALGLTAVVLVLALAGACVWFSGSKLLLGVLAVPGGQQFSTFVYKNHWAAFAILGATSAAGLGFSAWDRAGGDRREQTVRLFAFCAVVLILLTPALPVSRSGTVMAALVALVVATAALGRIVRRSAASRRRRWLLGLAALAVVALVVGRMVWLSQGSLETGWQRSVSEWRRVQERGQWNGRVYVAQDTWQMVRDRPWFGWGGGSFEPVFRIYLNGDGRERKVKISGRWDHAHCDWLEVAAEYGFVGLALLVGAALVGLWRIVRAGSRWGRWVLGGLAMIAVYAVAEFPFHNPAVLLLWTVLLTAAGTRRGRASEERSGYLGCPDRGRRPTANSGGVGD